jgi:DedD protein
MATPNPETSEIRRKGRQRLMGAITIVLLAVVFVPMLLDPEPRKDRKEPVLAIPSKEGTAPLPAPAATKVAEAAKPAESPKPDVAPKVAEAPQPAQVAPKAAEFKSAAKPEKPPEKAAVKAAEPKPAAAPKLEGFAIQVGAFGDEEKLKQAREKLAAAKITHFIERLPNGLTRLRTGPYKTREEAEKATAAVGAAGLDGKVVPLP